MSGASKKIFVFVSSRYERPRLVGAIALCEDGHVLASHVSSDEEWARHDMGVFGSTWQHEHYAAHCPDGFTLEWVDHPDTHPGVEAAGARNQELAAAAAARGEA